MLGRLPQLLDRRQNRAAARVPQHHDQPRAERLGRELDAANLGWRDDVARDSNHEQIAEALVEHDFGRYAGVGAAQDDREGRLLEGELDAPSAARARLRFPDVSDETAIAVAKAVEGLLG